MTGDHELFGNDEPDRALSMHYLDAEHWQAVIWVPDSGRDASLSYRYLLREPDGTYVHDAEQDRRITLNQGGGDLLVIDSWVPSAYFDVAFDTKPFRDVLLGSTARTGDPPNPDATHIFTVKAPLLPPHQTLCLLGQSKRLGQWQTNQPVLMTRASDDPWFQSQLKLSGEAFPLAYKYGVYDLTEKRFLGFEKGPDRVCPAPPMSGDTVVLHDIHARLELLWRGAGVAVPVFSLRSSQSFGTGEFADLELLADWAARAGFKLIQILPVNDTSATGTWEDSYPYAAISAFALHPIYSRLSEFGDAMKADLEKLEEERCRLNGLPEMDYEAVLKLKTAFLRKAFVRLGKETADLQDYKRFVDENKHWLRAYAVFCCLRDRYKTTEFQKWPDYRTFDNQTETRLIQEAPETLAEIAFHEFTQYHLHRQLSDAVAHIHARGLVVKGDIPIGVSRYGVDTWQNPHLFHLEMQAGAPPDPFSDKGQNWGFPTYNWDAMRETGYAWWRQRFAQMSRYFDAFRIDHILGFFRIWSVPTDAVEGILGRFVPALPVRPAEFLTRGIPFDRPRLTNPFINNEVLMDVFGADYQEAKEQFFDEDRFGRVTLKPEVSTQAKVQARFATRAADDRNQRLKQGLFDIIANVILLEDERDSESFHFRFDMAATSSFQGLKPETRHRIKELYVDYFFRRQERCWAKEGLEKLPALQRATRLLICGEDLGMVPACVPQIMEQLGLLSLEVQRMPKAIGQMFSRPAFASYLSVVTPGTHDMSSLREWWKEDPVLIEKFFREELEGTGSPPHECSPELIQQILQQHVQSPAMWAIFQIQDLLSANGTLRRTDGLSERINVPANPRHYWRYRMHVDLEELAKAYGFRQQLVSLLAEGGRIHHPAGQ